MFRTEQASRKLMSIATVCGAIIRCRLHFTKNRGVDPVWRDQRHKLHLPFFEGELSWSGFIVNGI